MKEKISQFCRKNIVVIGIGILLVFMAFAAPNYFAYSTLTGLLTQVAIYGIVACAMTIAIIGGEFDLSVSSILPLATLLFAAMLPTLGLPLTIVVVTLIGVGIGCINGFFVAITKINAFIVTLATMIAIKGIMLTFCDGMPMPAVNESARQLAMGNVGGITVTVMIFFGCVILTELVLRKTKYGRNVFATGGNYDVAQYAGINVRFIKFSLFAILGGAAALAGTLLTCRLQAGSPLYGSDVALYVVSAAVLGGTSLAGGRGSAVRTLLGMLFIGMLLQIFTYINVYTYMQQLIQGAIVVVVVIMDALPSRKKGSDEEPVTVGNPE
ncbi:ABC transporter permease [Christensenella tenuis]|jgi:ribose transport system permease protein|uniref:ABC transporter permease n=1 Tax=Christensenella tenuis TaxID=2763033 RepID=A0ABR7EHI4_9FIRM|nr:ABC transporter permease [Christensenella tenuis]MBC5649232.1 ABC transporter permease [Christensenella tenuis]